MYDPRAVLVAALQRNLSHVVLCRIYEINREIG
jgi:hypothetical protein